MTAPSGSCLIYYWSADVFKSYMKAIVFSQTPHWHLQDKKSHTPDSCFLFPSHSSISAEQTALTTHDRVVDCRMYFCAYTRGFGEWNCVIGSAGTVSCEWREWVNEEDPTAGAAGCVIIPRPFVGAVQVRKAPCCAQLLLAPWCWASRGTDWDSLYRTRTSCRWTVKRSELNFWFSFGTVPSVQDNETSAFCILEMPSSKSCTCSPTTGCSGGCYDLLS